MNELARKLVVERLGGRKPALEGVPVLAGKVEYFHTDIDSTGFCAATRRADPRACLGVGASGAVA